MIHHNIGLRRALAVPTAVIVVMALAAGCGNDTSNPVAPDFGAGASPAVTKRGHGGGGGTATTFDQMLSDAISASGSVTIVSDNKRKLETNTSSVAVDLAFDATAGQTIEDVTSSRSGDDILADGKCAFNCVDAAACAAATGGTDGIKTRLHDALTRADGRSLDVSVTVGQQHLGEAHSDHFVSLRDYGGSGDAAPGYPHLNLGKNEKPQNFLVATFDGPGTNPRDASTERNFTFSDGTVRVWERVDVNSSATLTCNNLDVLHFKLVPVTSGG